MPEQDQHHPLTPEAKSSLPLHEVFSQARQIEKRVHTASSFIQTAAGEQTWHTIEHLPVAERLAATQDLLLADKPDIYPNIEPYFELYNEAVQEQQALESQEAPRVEAILRYVTHDLIVTSDWDGIAAELMKPPSQEARLPYSEIVLAMRALHSGKRQLSLVETGSALNDLMQLQTIIDTTGFRLEKPLPESTEEWHIAGNLPEAIEDWSKVAEQAADYLSKDRFDWHLEHTPTRSLKLLTHALKDMHADISPLPAAVTEAFERVAGHEISNYLESEASFVAAENKDRPNSLFVQNIAEAANVFGLETGEVSDLIQRTFEEIPEHLTKGIGFVEFIHTLDESATEGDSGGHLPQENKIQIELGSYLAKKRLAQEQGATAQQAHTIALKYIEGTLKHEIGHYIHQRTLTVRELIVWQEALNDEPTAITFYVQQLIEEGVSQIRINKEQFSETWEAFMNTPQYLNKNFPKRYAAFKSFTQSEIL